jgi:hypothetical protein
VESKKDELTEAGSRVMVARGPLQGRIWKREMLIA